MKHAKFYALASSAEGRRRASNAPRRRTAASMRSQKETVHKHTHTQRRGEIRQHQITVCCVLRCASAKRCVCVCECAVCECLRMEKLWPGVARQTISPLATAGQSVQQQPKTHTKNEHTFSILPLAHGQHKYVRHLHKSQKSTTTTATLARWAIICKSILCLALRR